MTQTPVDNNAAGVLFREENGDRVLLGVYDNTYPWTKFQNGFQLLGGNRAKDGNDASPRALLQRELADELSGRDSTEGAELGQITGQESLDEKGPTSRVYTTDQGLLTELRAIGSEAKGVGDYLVVFDLSRAQEGRKGIFTNLISAFSAEVPTALIDRVEEELRAGREITNEGLTNVFTLRELMRENARGAWGWGGILGHMTELGIPEYTWMNVTPTGGEPRDSFDEYRPDFPNRNFDLTE